MKGTGPDRDRTQQTPGPWTAWQDPFDTTWHITHKLPDNRIIVGIIGDEGDARLVTAAPDLLAALKRAQHYMRNCGVNMDFYADIQAAINKAESPISERHLSTKEKS